MDRLKTDFERKLDENLSIAIEALRMIEDSDDLGPAHHIAKSALNQIQANTIDKED